MGVQHIIPHHLSRGRENISTQMNLKFQKRWFTCVSLSKIICLLNNRALFPKLKEKKFRNSLMPTRVDFQRYVDRHEPEMPLRKVEHGCSTHIGRRRAQEDCFLTELEVGGSEISLFGVFDGHNGSDASDFCSSQFSNFLWDELSRDLSSDLVSTLCALDSALKLALPNCQGGTTACVAAVRGASVWIANLGDSRAVVFSQEHAVRLETVDHKGVITSDCGELAVSRGVGDYRYKQFGLSSIADAYELSVSPHECLVIASDGLWDVMTSKEVGDFIGTFEMPTDDGEGTTTPRSKAQLIANALMLFAIESKCASDNISVVLVMF